jgi:hypothetical protein
MMTKQREEEGHERHYPTLRLMLNVPEDWLHLEPRSWQT